MKAFASDFDGTLFFHNRPEPINHSDISAIWDYQKQGYLFGLCTGRPLLGTLEYLTKEIQPDFYITNSGATIFDKDLNLIFEKFISKEIIDSLILYGVEHEYSVDFHMDGKFYAYGKSDSFIIDEIYSLNDICGKVHNITYDAKSEENAEELAKIVCQCFDGQVTAFRNTRYVDIVPFGCSKGTGTQFIREYLNVDFFAGIGDSMNDLPMLKNVDVPFTFFDAPEKLRENAAHLVNSVADAVRFML